MLVITCRFAQSAALIFKMDVSCITTWQILYYPVDVPSSVSISGSISVLCWLSWAYASRVTNSAQGSEVCEYTYLAGKLSNWERWAPEWLPVGAGRVPGRGGISSGVGCPRQSGGGVPVPLRLQCVSRLFAVPFGQGRHLAVCLWWSIAGCRSIADFIFLCQGNSRPCCFSSLTSVQVSWSGIAFRLLQHMKTVLGPFWPYPRPGTIWTVPAVPDLLALP